MGSGVAWVVNTEAVIFDMDGLLIDTEPVWRRSEVAVFRTVGLHLTEEQGLETMGVPILDVVRLWHSRHLWDEPSIEAVANQIIRAVETHVREEGVPMPGVLEALQ